MSADIQIPSPRDCAKTEAQPQALPGVKNSECWQRQAVLGLTPLIYGFGLLGGIIFMQNAIGGRADFRGFYCAGYMLRIGEGHQLYDFAEQKRIQDLRVLPLSDFIPAIHAPYEYFLFAPLSLVSYKAAYLIWMAINYGLAILCYKSLLPRSDGWLLLALMAGFQPLSGAIGQGQDSVIILLLCALALDKDDFIAGMLIGLGVFKFNVVLPVALAYLVWRRWRFIAGFAVTSIPACVFSLWVVGAAQVRLYLREVPEIRQFNHSTMPNVRGLLHVFLGSGRLSNIIALAVAALVLWLIRKRKASLSTALAIVPLVAYHLMFHDLAILLIPITLRLRRGAGGFLQWLSGIGGFAPALNFLPLLATPLLFASEDQ